MLFMLSVAIKSVTLCFAILSVVMRNVVALLFFFFLFHKCSGPKTISVFPVNHFQSCRLIAEVRATRVLQP